MVGMMFLKTINQSLYQEILLLQKFNDMGGNFLKTKKISLQPQKKMRTIFGEQTSRILEPSPQYKYRGPYMHTHKCVTAYSCFDIERLFSPISLQNSVYDHFMIF